MKDSMYHEEFQKVAEAKVTPQPIQQSVVEVEFCGEGSLIGKFATVEYSAIESQICSQGGVVPFSEEEFLTYCRTIVYSRISWVNNQPYVMHPLEKVMVPGFLSDVCMNIGTALDVSLGITLKPKMVGQMDSRKDGEDRVSCAIRSYGLMSLDEMKRISGFLRAIPGYRGALGYLKDKSGTFDFMSMQLVDGVIAHHDAKVHPVYALLASVVGPHMVASALSPLVRYGDSAFLSNLLWEVTSV